VLLRPVIVAQAKHCAPAHCRCEPSTGSALIPDIFGGIAPFSNAGYPYELEKQISYVFAPDFRTSDVEKRDFSTERTELLFGFWVVTVKSGFFSCGSDTVVPSVKQNATQMRCRFKSTISSSRVVLDKRSPLRSNAEGLWLQNSLAPLRR
jgi:hypothetical protein